MGTKVEKYQADDGKVFDSERDMIAHEIVTTIAAKWPELRIAIPAIRANIDAIGQLFAPLIPHLPENHPEVPANTTLETTPDWGELAGTCSCSASMSGNSGPHATDCPLHRASVGFPPEGVRLVAPMCGAVQHSDQMSCSRCHLTWDVNDFSPPQCRPLPSALGKPPSQGSSAVPPLPREEIVRLVHGPAVHRAHL